MAQKFSFLIFISLMLVFMSAGCYYLGRRILTNREMGYWGPPQRFSVPPEITKIKLSRGA